ncbi:MAG: hypothetical protein GXO55_07860 [Chloroflexi bacterium]|nr:hypothetical protein [Chloroflexota bacterium]
MKQEISRRIALSPIAVGLIAAGLASVFIFVGVLRGNIPLNLQSLMIALLIGAGSWGVVAWAIAQAAADVEGEIVQLEELADE